MSNGPVIFFRRCVTLIMVAAVASIILADRILANEAMFAGSADRGKVAFVKHGCWQCHGFEGQGSVATSNGAVLAPIPRPSKPSQASFGVLTDQCRHIVRQFCQTRTSRISMLFFNRSLKRQITETFRCSTAKGDRELLAPNRQVLRPKEAAWCLPRPENQRPPPHH